MNLTIDQQAIESAIQSTATAAIHDAVGHYSMKSAIVQVVLDQLSSSSITTAVGQAVAQVNTQELADALAAEIVASIRRGVLAVVQESLVEMVAKLRGLSTYSDKAAIQELRREMYPEHPDARLSAQRAPTAQDHPGTSLGNQEEA